MGGPGRSYRTGLTLVQAVEFFDDPVFTEQWFIEQRWPDGVTCPRCESTLISPRKNRRPQPFRCNDCRFDFSVKSWTLMHGSPLKLKVWGLALYLLTTHQKGVSSLKLHRALGVTQKTAWFLGHRIRAAWNIEHAPFTGTVEVDETQVGGREGNKHRRRKLENRGVAGKVAVLGLKARRSHQVYAVPVPHVKAETLRPLVLAHTDASALVVTDEAGGYHGLRRRHATVNHSAGEYVRGNVYTNGIESFWATLKRGYVGTYHWWSPKHLARYVTEFAGRNNHRSLDTIEQMAALARGLSRKRLRYSDLVR